MNEKKLLSECAVTFILMVQLVQATCVKHTNVWMCKNGNEKKIATMISFIFNISVLNNVTL